MDIKEFAFRQEPMSIKDRVDKTILSEIIKAAEEDYDKRRSLKERILQALRCLSPKRWF